MAPKKTFLQQLVEAAVWIVSGIQALAAISLFKNSHGLITIKVVLAITFLALSVYIILSVLCRLRKIPWVSESGQALTIIKIGRKPVCCFLGGLLVLWGIAINNLYKEQPAATLLTERPARQPVFNPGDRRFKILILPWEEECEYQGKKYDIGRVIQRRLNMFELEDHTKLNTHYLTDSLDFRNFTHEMADSLMRFHRANLILYGSYSFKECEGGTSDKICFNYQTSNTDHHLCSISKHTEYNMVDLGGLNDIRKGNGQAEIDGIIHRAVAVAEMKRYNYAAAVSRIRKSTGFWQNEEMLFLAGICYYYMKDYNNAQRCYETVLKLKPGHAEAAMHLGVVLASGGKWEDGKKWLEHALAADSSNMGALRNIALISLANKDTVTAKTYIGKINRQSPPGNEHALFVLGNIYQAMGDHRSAKNYLERSLQAHAYHPERWNDLAKVHLHLKDTVAAMASLKRAVTFDPNYADGWYDMGIIYVKQKNFSQAQTHFEKAVKANPRHALAWASLGRNYYFFSAQKERAVDCLEKAIALDPENDLVLATAVSVYKDAKDFMQAKKHLETLSERHPKEGVFLNELGVVYGHLDNYKKALECFKRTLSILPENAATYYNLAGTYSCMYNKKEALSYLTKAVACDTTVKSFVDTDKSFSWLQGSRELCQIIQ